MLDESKRGFFSETSSNGLFTKSHPDFPGVHILYNPSGDSWHKNEGAQYVRGLYFLDEFRLSHVLSKKDKTVDEIAKMLFPLDDKNKCFFDLTAVQGVQDAQLSIEPRNLNVDLAMQFKIRQMIGQGAIDQKTFVVISHGHFLAGIAELTKAITPENKYMFDTTVYFPKGTWPPNIFQARNATKQQLQLWSEEIGRAKETHKIKGRIGAGGVAIGLYGHRNDFDIEHTSAKASIDPVKLFGSTGEFIKLLTERGLEKVVIISEENSLDPKKITSLPLTRLKNGLHGRENFDLYDYFKELSEKGIPITVLSGDTRPPVTALGKKLAQDEE